MTHQEYLFSLPVTILLFYDISVAMDITWEG